MEKMRSEKVEREVNEALRMKEIFEKEQGKGGAIQIKKAKKYEKYLNQAIVMENDVKQRLDFHNENAKELTKMRVESLSNLHDKRSLNRNRAEELKEEYLMGQLTRVVKHNQKAKTYATELHMDTIKEREERAASYCAK